MKNEKSEVIQAVEALAHEKDISVDMLYTAIEEAIRVAYKRNLPKDVVPPTSVVARMNRVSGAINVYARMLVVDEVTNPSAQIDLAHAQKIRPSAQVDDIIEQDVTPKGFLRVAALTAKQVIMQRIREAERGKIYDEYVEKTPRRGTPRGRSCQGLCPGSAAQRLQQFPRPAGPRLPHSSQSRQAPL